MVHKVRQAFSLKTLLNWQNNWALKLISVFFAVLLWYFVVGEDKIDTTIYVPVEIVNLPRELVISNQFKKQLEATVSGPRGLVNSLTRQPIARTINLSKAEPGTVVIRNEPETLQFPRGINVLRVQPTHLTLVIDRLIEREFQIRPITTGSLPSGYELESISIEPASLRISGPSAVLDAEKVLTTSAIDLNDLKESSTVQISLPMRPELLNLIGETMVTAHIVIKEKTTQKIISKVPVRVIPPPGNGKIVEVKPDTVSVHVVLPLSSSKENSQDLVEARVQIQDLSPGTHRLPVEILAAEQIKVLDVNPADVSIKITD